MSKIASLLIAATALFAAAVIAKIANAKGGGPPHVYLSEQQLREMDTDRNGRVSRDEFMRYMSQTFKRLDVNRNGQLESRELRPARHR